MSGPKFEVGDRVHVNRVELRRVDWDTTVRSVVIKAFEGQATYSYYVDMNPSVLIIERDMYLLCKRLHAMQPPK